ncbi:hypothetical protein A4A49_29753 [Nicotiana attenuata]|uniref:Uncharacterized protein n=1 Tax=Nicotiana attenuata TaxID=49451 RepID=A0A314KV10_NICAT|nr:hypothetical protein A4A49_29753 [Nicotiana attenuata]
MVDSAKFVFFRFEKIGPLLLLSFEVLGAISSSAGSFRIGFGRFGRPHLHFRPPGAHRRVAEVWGRQLARWNGVKFGGMAWYHSFSAEAFEAFPPEVMAARLAAAMTAMMSVVKTLVIHQQILRKHAAE